MTIMIFLRSLFVALPLICCGFPAAAQDGAIPHKIVFGQTAALGGPASALGQGMNEGILAAFKEINDQGGANGYSLDLVSYDDGYEPERAIKNAEMLIHKDKVFALIGGVGTPTANAVEPISSAQKVPFVGAFSGAEFLRQPFKPYVVNIRASYWQETEEWIERLTTDLGLTRIAILYQDDSYGRAGLSGVKRALEKRHLSLVGQGRYERNTTAVKSAVLAIRKSKPEAVVMVGAYKPCAEFIKVARQINFNPLFVNISFVGSDALAQELNEQGEGVIVSQVVPFPYDPKSSTLVARYQQALHDYKEESHYGFVSMEGYMVGRFVGAVLAAMDPQEITREKFIQKIYEMRDIPLDDIELHFGTDDNQGMDKVFMTIMQKDGSFKSVQVLE